MKFLKPTNILIFFFILNCGFLSAQIPAGGISLIKETLPNYQKLGNITVTTISISDQTFTSGFRLTSTANVNNTWDSQIQFTKVAGIENNDVILISFYARTIASLQESGDGAIIACIEENKDPYGKQIYQKVAIGHDWKQYFVPLKSKATLPMTGVSYSFHTGFASQTIEVADVKFLNYKNTITLEALPVTEITYYGRENDAPWRAVAAERINQIRKGNVDIVVYDEQGAIVKDAKVSIEMVKHKFGFGSAVASGKFIGDAVYRKKVYELFNEVVLENDLKWPSFNPNPSYNTTRTLDSLAKHGIAVRGHNLVWPSFNYNLASLKTLSTNPVAFRNEIDRHIDQAVLYAKGKVIDWDVLNEPYTNKEFQAILGNEVMADWFKRVRQNDREVKLYINDYSILSAGGMDINHQNGYYDIINYIDSKGGKIQGIGLQGHFGSDLTPIAKVYSILEKFATLGKEIKITEHDINTTQRAVQADYTRDFMTIVFSHQSVKSFLFWGFWANQHWLPEGALYEADWSIRPNGQAYLDLVFNQWWTKKTELVTDSVGKTPANGFLGTYKYTITSGEKVRTGTFKIENSVKSGIENLVILSFDKTIPDNISIKTNKPSCLCEGENITLQAPSGADFSYKWYRGTELLPEVTSAIVADVAGKYSVKIEKGPIVINSDTVEVKVNKLPEAILTKTGDLEFCPGGKITFSANVSNDLTYSWYKGSTKIQGSVTSIDVSESGSYSLVTNAYGCSTKTEAVSVLVYSPTNPKCTTGINQMQNLIRVYPNPFKDSFTLDAGPLNNSSASLELFNASGIRVYNLNTDKLSEKTTIYMPAPGFYSLRVSNKDEVSIFKLIGN